MKRHPHLETKLRAKQKEWMDNGGREYLAGTSSRIWDGPEFRARNREYMTTRNPAKNPENMRKAQQTKKARGVTYEHLTGGNGAKSPAEKKVMGLLGEPWKHNHAVSMGAGSRVQGLPPHYKIDLARPDLNLGVELDGNSHNSPRARALDEKKDRALAERGWTILRFGNPETENDTNKCVVAIREAERKLSTT